MNSQQESLSPAVRESRFKSGAEMIAWRRRWWLGREEILAARRLERRILASMLAAGRHVPDPKAMPNSYGVETLYKAMLTDRLTGANFVAEIKGFFGTAPEMSAKERQAHFGRQIDAAIFNRRMADRKS
jgi:hypothetical protein